MAQSSRLSVRLRPANLGGVLLATFFSTLFSPSLWLLQVALSPWINWKSLAQNISQTGGAYALVVQLKSLGAGVLLTQLAPALLLCLGVGVLYHWSLLKLFGRVRQLFEARRSPQ